MLKVQVIVMEQAGGNGAVWASGPDGYLVLPTACVIREYIMDHDNTDQRRVLGEQCRNAFEAGQIMLTYPVGKGA